MQEVRLRLKLSRRQARLGLFLMLALAAISLLLGLPRIALVAGFGVTWNLVPGLCLLFLAAMLFGPPPEMEEPREPVVGYVALMVGLPVVVAVMAYGMLGKHWLVGRDLTVLARLADGDPSGVGFLPRILLHVAGPRVPALLLGGLLVHAANAVLVGFLGLRISRDRAVGLLSGVLFAAYPLSVQAVSWLSGERLLEGSLAILLSLHLAALALPFERPQLRVYRKKRRADLHREREQRRLERRSQTLRGVAYFFSLILFVIALFLTPLALILPLLIAILHVRDLDRLRYDRPLASGLKPAVTRALGHVGILVLVLGLRLAGGGANLLDPEEPLASFSTIAANLVTFPRHLIMPLASPFFGTEALLIMLGVLLVMQLLLLALARSRPQRSAVITTVLLTFSMALPALPFLTPTEDPHGCRFLYLAGAGYVILGALFLRRALLFDRSSGGWLIIGLALALSVTTLRLNLRLWRQGGRLTWAMARTLSRIAVEMPPGSAIVLQDLPRDLDTVPLAHAEDFRAGMALYTKLTKREAAEIVDEIPAELPQGARYRLLVWNGNKRWLKEIPIGRPPVGMVGEKRSGKR